ncbi:CoA-binding protein [bacterium]|nr:CoA-binding protein [bacterium]
MSETIIEQLDPIFKPRSIAIIGASNRPGKWGNMVLNGVLASGYRGPIYPVNPKESEIKGLKTYGDILDIPGMVDLAVFTIPAVHMPGTMRNCVKKGVRGGIVISADFAETGENGEALQAETVRIAREGGLRFVGPNCNGIWTSAGGGLSISPMPRPMAGSLAFISQSGMFGGTAIRAAWAQGFGLSKFISIGNQADLTVADYLLYLAEDADTRVIALYVEGFKDARRFLQVAGDVSRKKPILLLKGGSSPVGARAAKSHTASIAGEDRIVDAVCRQAGIIRVEQMEHLMVMAEALMKQPLPRGDRVAVVGNGGQGVTCVDNLWALGLTVPEFKAEDKLALKAILPPHAPLPNNPVDFAAGGFETKDEVRVIEKLAFFNYIDGIITNVPTERNHSHANLADQKIAMIQAMAEYGRLPEKYGKPVIAQRVARGEQALELMRAANIPLFTSSQDCALAMYALMKYAAIKNRD